MRPLIGRMLVFALGGAFIATAWVWSLWAMIGTLPVEHGQAPALTPPARIAVVEEVVEPPAPAQEAVKRVPPPPARFNPNLDGRNGVGVSASSVRGEFGGR